MKLRRAVALLVALVLGAVAAPGSAGTTGQLRGRVLDAATKAPLAGVKVSIAAPSQSASATTDATGSFSFISLAPDSYTVSLDKQGYDWIAIEMPLAAEPGTQIVVGASSADDRQHTTVTVSR